LVCQWPNFALVTMVGKNITIKRTQPLYETLGFKCALYYGHWSRRQKFLVI
jgi:hypothetical protein